MENEFRKRIFSTTEIMRLTLDVIKNYFGIILLSFVPIFLFKFYTNTISKTTEVINNSKQEINPQFVVFFLLSLVFSILIILFLSYISRCYVLDEKFDFNEMITGILLKFFSSIGITISICIAVLVFGIIFYALILGAILGGLGALLSEYLSKIYMVFNLGILLSISIVLIMVISWFIFTYFLIGFENISSFEALNESKRLTDNMKIDIFFKIIPLVLIILLINILLSKIPYVGNLFFVPLFATFSNIFFTIFISLLCLNIYFAKDLKEFDFKAARKKVSYYEPEKPNILVNPNSDSKNIIYSKEMFKDKINSNLFDGRHDLKETNYNFETDSEVKSLIDPNFNLDNFEENFKQKLDDNDEESSAWDFYL